MGKAKFGKWEYSEEELKKQFAKATKNGEKAIHQEPQARSAHYDRQSNRIIIDLKNGATLIVPCKLVRGLADASPDDITQVELGPRGAALHWEKLDVDFSIQGLMTGRFGSKKWMAEPKQRTTRAMPTRTNNRKSNRLRRAGN